MICDLYNHVSAVRLGRQLKKRNQPRDVCSATNFEISGLVEKQIAHWFETGLDQTAMLKRCHELNNTSISVFVFEIAAGEITVWNKPEIAFIPGLERVQWAQAWLFRGRSYLYRVFLEAAMAHLEINGKFTFALDVNDIGIEGENFPLFTFQKHFASRNVLLPDVDFFNWNWYVNSKDHRRYEDKKIAACFAGSSSGGWISEQTILDLALPRLRTAAYFVGSPDVTFRIASAVQCQTRHAKALLRRQPYFGSRISWPEQLTYRFLLSMDGNGAACSRLAIALKSNSAAVKFDSPFVLYYFSAMVAGRDYIAVSAEREVEELLDLEKRAPGRFKPVASAGTNFFRRFLNMDSVLDYAGALMARYACLYRG